MAGLPADASIFNPEYNTAVAALLALGFSSGQIERMSDQSKMEIVAMKQPAANVSILPDGEWLVVRSQPEVLA